MSKMMKLAIGSVVVVVGACGMCGVLGALVGSPGHTAATSTATTSVHSNAAPPAAAEPPAQLGPAELDQVAATLATALDSATTAKESRHIVDAVRFFSVARTALDRVPAAQRNDARIASLVARFDETASGLTSYVGAATPVLHAQTAIEARESDVLARYEGIVAAQRELAGVASVPDELRSEVDRAKRALERAERQLRERALDLRLARTIEAQGLIAVTARELAEEFRGNEVVAEQRFKGHRLAVDGTVSEIRTDFLGNAIVELRTSNMFLGVDARVERSVAARLARGNRVVLACECEGMVVGSPQLDECSILDLWQ